MVEKRDPKRVAKAAREKERNKKIKIIIQFIPSHCNKSQSEFVLRFTNGGFGIICGPSYMGMTHVTSVISREV